MLERLDSNYDILCESGVFIEFYRNPLVYDTISNYISYVITGSVKEKLPEEMKKKKNQSINQNDVIDFLSNSLCKKYKESQVLKGSFLS